MLYAVELRLGTPAELPSDLDRAQAIAHRLNNLLTQASLRRALEELSPGGAVPGSAHADETGAKA